MPVTVICPGKIFSSVRLVAASSTASRTSLRILAATASASSLAQQEALPLPAKELDAASCLRVRPATAPLGNWPGPVKPGRAAFLLLPSAARLCLFAAARAFGLQTENTPTTERMRQKDSAPYVMI